MNLHLDAIHHVQLTVPRALEEATHAFYTKTFGLERIPKPEGERGAWYRLGAVELHVSPEDVELADNERSKRHICVSVSDLAATEAALRAAGVTIIPENKPLPGWKRFYVRDPGGNRIEVAEVPAAT